MGLFDLKGKIKEKVNEVKKLDGEETPGRIQEVEKEMNDMKKQELATKENTEKKTEETNKQTNKENQLPELSQEEKDEMSVIFHEKYRATQRQQEEELKQLQEETKQRINIITKEYQGRIEEVKAEAKRKKRNILDTHEAKLNRYQKLMNKMGYNPQTQKTLERNTKKLEEQEIEETKKETINKFENVKPQPITEEDKKLKREIDEFLEHIEKDIPTFPE